MIKRVIGFTLVELMITLLVAAVLLTVGAPSFIETIRRNRTVSQANELVTALYLARSEAVERGSQVTIRKLGAEWEDGWQVFVDEDNDGEFDAPEDFLIQEYTSLSEGYTLRTGGHFSNWVAYTPSGISRGNGGINGTFRLCDDAQDPASGRGIAINMVGRVSVLVDRVSADKEKNTCP